MEIQKPQTWNCSWWLHGYEWISMHFSELVNLTDKKCCILGTWKNPVKSSLCFTLRLSFHVVLILREGMETFDISTMSIMIQTGITGRYWQLSWSWWFCQQQRNADTSNMSPCSDGICWLQLLLPLHEVIVQVIRHGLPKLRKKLIGHPSILPACQIYATNMARPKWHTSFYANIAQNQEISGRVLLFSRFDFDLSFSTSLNPQIISIKKLLVHKKTHHQPTFKKSHNLSNMRNHNPRMFWSYPTVWTVWMDRFLHLN